MMMKMRQWFRKHRRTLLIGGFAVGAGIIVYKIVKFHNARLLAEEEERKVYTALLQKAEEHAETQLRSHFETIQRISDSTTLPPVLPQLKDRLFKQVDLFDLTEKLMLAKDDPQALSPDEKLQLWQRLKILSFTRTLCAMWALTLLELFGRVQLNIIGGHMYIDMMRNLSALPPDDQSNDVLSSCQHKYLAFINLFPYGVLEILIRDIQMAAQNVLQGMSLKEPCTLASLRGIFKKICMDFESQKMEWLPCVLLDKRSSVEEPVSAFVNATQLHVSEVTPHDADVKLYELVTETRSVLLSHEFGELLKISIEALVDGIMEEFYSIFDGVNTVPLAKLLPHIANAGALLLEHPSENRFTNIIASQPQLHSFCAMIYSSASSSQSRR